MLIMLKKYIVLFLISEIYINFIQINYIQVILNMYKQNNEKLCKYYYINNTLMFNIIFEKINILLTV